jgi:hypothetical protein
VSWSQHIKTQFHSTTTTINDSLNQKFPKTCEKTAVCYNYIKDVWQETFPQEHSKAKSKIEKRKEIAKKQKEMVELSEEELAKMEGEIPEWKKGALATTNLEAEEEKPGMLRRATQKVKGRFDKTSAA